MFGENLPGEYRIRYVDGESDGEEGNAERFTGESMARRGCTGGEGGGGGGVEMGLEAGQHQESSGLTTVGGSSLR